MHKRHRIFDILIFEQRHEYETSQIKNAHNSL